LVLTKTLNTKLTKKYCLLLLIDVKTDAFMLTNESF